MQSDLPPDQSPPDPSSDSPGEPATPNAAEDTALSDAPDAISEDAALSDASDAISEDAALSDASDAIPGDDAGSSGDGAEPGFADAHAAGEGSAPPPPPPYSGAGTAPGGWAPSFQVLRAKHDRKLGGVAGGLAAASNLDPTLVRFAIVLGCLTGWGILAYLIAWAVIPEEDPAKARYLMPAPEPTQKYLRIGLMIAGGLGVLHVLGAILGVVSSVLIGIGLFPAHLFGLTDNDGFEAGEGLLGLLLLIGGLLLVFRHHLPWMPTPDTGGTPGPWGPPGAGSGPGSWTQSGAGASAGSTPPPVGVALATIAPGSGGGGATYGPPPPGAGGYGAGNFGADPGGFGARASAAARVARTNGPLLLVRATGWLVGLWFLAAALVAGAFWLAGALEVSLPVLPIVASLAAVGLLGFVLVRSRRMAAVIGAMALLLVPLTLGAALVRVDGQAGDRSVVPMSMSDLQPKYRHAVGVLTLDLSNLRLPPGRTAVDISMGVGKVQVTVPWDANVEAAAEVSVGAFDLFGNRQTGVNLDGRSRSTGQPGAPLLVITGDAGAAEIIVSRGFEPFTQQALRTGQPVPMQCHPTSPYFSNSGGPLRCVAADGVTQTPALNCIVAEEGGALCRPPGEPEPAVAFGDDPGTRRCQVPAGGGDATCSAPIPGSTANAGTSYRCTIPPGGGQAVCRPTDPDSDSDSGDPDSEGTPSSPNPPGSPATPASPTPPSTPANPDSPTTAGNPPPPTDPSATPTTMATSPGSQPGEYRCTIPPGGGPATCQPL